jgi:hypothetical protein
MDAEKSTNCSTTIDVRVTRYSVRRTQLGAAFVPIALGTGILAKRVPDLVPASLVFAFYAALLIMILGGVKRLGWRPLAAAGGEIRLGEGLSVRRADVTRWAYDRELARVYGDEQSFALRARPDDAGRLRAQLTQVLGEGHRLQPRGSFVARRIVLILASTSLLVAIVAVLLHKVVLAIVCGVCLLFAVATYLTLRQRVLRL